MSAFRKLTGSISAGLVFSLTFSAASQAADQQTGAAAPSNTVIADFLDAAYLPGLDRVVVAGHHGMVGLLEVGDSAATVKLMPDMPDADFTALARISDSEVLIGSSKGVLYHFDGSTITQLAELSEYEEPILDIAHDGGYYWVVGARGLVAQSRDGKTFEEVEIRDVTLPKTEFPGAHAADWYFGVSNLNLDTIEFSATLNGEPALEEEHYIMYPDEGFVQFQQELDANPPPTIATKFAPGPPFRLGDVSWNVVLVKGATVTLAGEFGMILQSEDNGETWIRRDTEIVPREPEPAYWMTGVQNGEQMWLAGAAGVSQVSNDGGVTWTDNPKPGREGIFGVTIATDGTPVIAGAVGLIGTLKDGDWTLADRTQLQLLSWLRQPVALPDGTVLVTGGRAAAIRYVNGEFVRVPVTR